MKIEWKECPLVTIYPQEVLYQIYMKDDNELAKQTEHADDLVPYKWCCSNKIGGSNCTYTET